MAKHARILSAIWTDPEFLGLPAGAQRLYLLILSQGDVSMAGTVSLRLRRWAALAPDTDVDELKAAQKLLELRSFIVVDEDTEELWVRSWLRHNDVVKPSSTLVPAFDRAAADVMSLAIRTALVTELDKVLIELPDDGSRAAFVGRLTGWIRDSCGGGPGPAQLRLIGENYSDGIAKLADRVGPPARSNQSDSVGISAPVDEGVVPGQDAGDGASDDPCHAPSDGASRVVPVSSSAFHPSPITLPPSPRRADASPSSGAAGVEGAGVLVRQSIAMLASQQVDEEIAAGSKVRSRDAVVRKRVNTLTLQMTVELNELARTRTFRGPADLLDTWRERRTWPEAIENARRYGERIHDQYRGLDLVIHLRDEFGGSRASSWSTRRRTVSPELARAQRLAALESSIAARGGRSAFTSALLDRLLGARALTPTPAR